MSSQSLPRDKILISACLMGRPVRYDGRAKPLHHALIEQWQAEGRLVIHCPEVAAGFSTPRLPAEIEGGRGGAAVLADTARILDKSGADVTAQFRHGAELALAKAQASECRFALLTDGSPSCGTSFIYAGAFDGVTRPDRGVTAALLEANGIRVFPQSGIETLAALLDR